MRFYIYNIIKIVFVRECDIGHCPTRKLSRVSLGQIAQNFAEVFNKDIFYCIANGAWTVDCAGRQEFVLFVEKTLNFTCYVFVCVRMEYFTFPYHGNLSLNKGV